MTDFNIAVIHQAIAAAVGDREAVVWRDRRITWAGGGRPGSTESSVVRLIDIACEVGELDDPIARQEIAQQQCLRRRRQVPLRRCLVDLDLSLLRADPASILSERVLGLSRELEADRVVSFGESRAVTREAK